MDGSWCCSACMSSRACCLCLPCLFLPFLFLCLCPSRLAFAFVALALAHLPRPLGDGALELLLGLLLLGKLGSLVLGSCVSPVFLASMPLVVMPTPPHNCAVLVTPPEHNMSFLRKPQPDSYSPRASLALIRLVPVCICWRLEHLAVLRLVAAKAGVTFLICSGTCALVPVTALARAGFTTPVTEQAVWLSTEKTW